MSFEAWEREVAVNLLGIAICVPKSSLTLFKECVSLELGWEAFLKKEIVEGLTPCPICGLSRAGFFGEPHSQKCDTLKFRNTKFRISTQ
jgi:hypothetical protein